MDLPTGEVILDRACGGQNRVEIEALALAFLVELGRHLDQAISLQDGQAAADGSFLGYPQVGHEQRMACPADHLLVGHGPEE